MPTFLLFLGIGASFRYGFLVRCPPCMRKELGRLALINALPANLMWVLILAPWYGIAALRTFTQGHSRGVESPASAPGYRQADRPAQVASPMGKPWHDDPKLRSFFSADAPDELYAVFEIAGFGVERLRVRLLRRHGTGYVAQLLEPSRARPSLHVGDEIDVQTTESDPPLRWVHEPEPPTGLGRQAERYWQLAFFAVGALMVFAVAAAGYSSESAGVGMAYPAAALIGFFLGGWRSIPWARRRRMPGGIPFAFAFGTAIAFAGAAIFFFEGIFPAL